MRKKSTEVKFLKKEQTIFWIAALTVLFQSFLSALTIFQIIEFEINLSVNIGLALLIAILLDWFVLTYVINGNEGISKIFCSVSIIFNLYEFVWKKLENGWDMLAVPSFCFAVIVPLSVYFVSDLIINK